MRIVIGNVAGRMLLATMLLALLVGCGARRKPEIGTGNFPVAGSGGLGARAVGVDPNNPAAPAQQFDADGNPIGFSVTRPGGVIPVGAPIPELLTINFDFDKADLTAAGMEILLRNAAYLRSNPQLHVNLRGHTDDLGTEEYNLSLGQLRAQTVREALIAEGVAPQRLHTVSFGMALPAVAGEDEESRALNRRVEFFVFTP